MELPPNATVEELGLIEAIQPGDDLDPGILDIRGLKLDAPDNFLPFLIWEYGLGEILDFLENPREAIKEGIQWQRLRGTEAGLRLALSWIGMEDAYTEEEGPGAHFAEFQLDPGSVPKNENSLTGLLTLAKLSIPARSHLSRIFHGYDIRRMILDDSEFGLLLSDNSGVHLEGFPVLSFGRSDTFFSSISDPFPQYALNHQFSIRGHYEDRALLDVLLLGDKHLVNHQASHLHGFWSLFGPLEIETTKNINTFCKAEIVLSDSDPLGWTNACLAGFSKQEEGEYLYLDDTELDDRYVVIKVPIDERFDKTHGAGAQDESSIQSSFIQLPNHYDWHYPLGNFPILSEDKPQLNHRVIRKPYFTFFEQKSGQFWTSARWPKKSWKNTEEITGIVHSLLNPGGAIRLQDHQIGRIRETLFTHFTDGDPDRVLHHAHTPTHTASEEFKSQTWAKTKWPSSSWNNTHAIIGAIHSNLNPSGLIAPQDQQVGNSRETLFTFFVDGNELVTIDLGQGPIHTSSQELENQFWVDTNWPDSAWEDILVIIGTNHNHLYPFGLIKPQDHQLTNSRTELFVYFNQGGPENEPIEVRLPFRTFFQEMDSQFWTDTNWPDDSWNQTETIIGINHERSN
jgi:hypothetical protein